MEVVDYRPNPLGRTASAITMPSGTWSSAEADAFDAALVEMRQVDPADWESAG
jgi:hypothetical protein